MTTLTGLCVNLLVQAGQDLLIATGWGINRLLVNVLSVELPGLQWALVVVLKQTMLREFNGPLDTVTFMVRVLHLRALKQHSRLDSPLARRWEWVRLGWLAWSW